MLSAVARPRRWRACRFRLAGRAPPTVLDSDAMTRDRGDAARATCPGRRPSSPSRKRPPRRLRDVLERAGAPAFFDPFGRAPVNARRPSCPSSPRQSSSSSPGSCRGRRWLPGLHPSAAGARGASVSSRAWVDGTMAPHFLATLTEIVIGFVVGATLAVVIGYLLARSVVAERLLSPYLVAAQATPILVLAPLLVLWLGTGLLPKVVICALIVFFPVAVATMVGHPVGRQAAAGAWPLAACNALAGLPIPRAARGAAPDPGRHARRRDAGGHRRHRRRVGRRRQRPGRADQPRPRQPVRLPANKKILGRWGPRPVLSFSKPLIYRN